MTGPQARLREQLELSRWPASQGPHLRYRGPADFVLREGTDYEPSLRPAGLPGGAPKACFANAIALSLSRGLPYVEGFAWTGFFVAHHAWNVDGEEVIDITWPELRVHERAYRGVAFSVERAHMGSWHHDATVLDDPLHDWPVLHELWMGEESPGDLEGMVERIAADLRVDPEFAGEAHLLDRMVATWGR